MNEEGKTPILPPKKASNIALRRRNSQKDVERPNVRKQVQSMNLEDILGNESRVLSSKSYTSYLPRPPQPQPEPIAIEKDEFFVLPEKTYRGSSLKKSLPEKPTRPLTKKPLPEKPTRPLTKKPLPEKPSTQKNVEISKPQKPLHPKSMDKPPNVLPPRERLENTSHVQPGRPAKPNKGTSPSRPTQPNLKTLSHEKFIENQSMFEKPVERWKNKTDTNSDNTDRKKITSKAFEKIKLNFQQDSLELDKQINNQNKDHKQDVVKLREKKLPPKTQSMCDIVVPKKPDRNKKCQSALFGTNEIANSKEELDKRSSPESSNLNKMKSLSSPNLLNEPEEDELDSGKKPKFNLRKNFLNKKQLRRKFFSYHESSSTTEEGKDYRSRAVTAPVIFERNEELDDLDVSIDGEWFHYVLVVSLREKDGVLEPYNSYTYPPQIDKKLSSTDFDVASIPQFCFPDTQSYTFNKNETFSFVLTDDKGGRLFGFCRSIQVSSSKFPEAYCIISPLGLFALYSQILDEVEKQRRYSSSAVFSFLKTVLTHPLPSPASAISVSFFTPDHGRKTVEIQRPGDSAIHEHVDLYQLFNTLPVKLIVGILGKLLLESKIILSSSSLSLLSSCCHGFISLLYPFTWEHTYIPVLPTKLIDIVCVPSPYLLGLLPNAIAELEDMPIDDEVLVIDLDSKEILLGDFQEAILPKDLSSIVTESLEELLNFSTPNAENKVRNTVITNVFVECYIQMMGHFENFYKTESDGTEVINKKPFYRAAQTKERKAFLKKFVSTQAFQQFATSRKTLGPSKGLFETCFAEWKRTRKTEHSSKFKDLISNFKSKMKSR